MSSQRSSVNDFMHMLFNFNAIFIFSAESQEVLDAEISARVLQLINVTDSGIHSQVGMSVFSQVVMYYSSRI